MQIKIAQSIAGHANPLYDLPEFSFASGQLADVDADLAAAWIASGVAVEVSAFDASNANRKAKKDKV